MRQRITGVCSSKQELLRGGQVGREGQKVPTAEKDKTTNSWALEANAGRTPRCGTRPTLPRGFQRVHAQEQFPSKITGRERRKSLFALSLLLKSQIMFVLSYSSLPWLHFFILHPSPRHLISQDRMGHISSLCHVSYFFLPFIVWDFTSLMRFFFLNV